ncbi:MAG: hypothetical protein ACI81P_001288 [Neolewinella sp.]|jgi:hypothetical protein
MKKNKLTLDKSVLARLQNDQLAAVVGGGERPCSGTISTITIETGNETATPGQPEGESCCRKSC